MTVIQAFILGLFQGATEFIPVSSSGHLTLIPWLFGWTFDLTMKGAFDVLAHWGTLVAVVVVFWRDLLDLGLGGLRSLGGLKNGGVRGVVAYAQQDVHARLAWLIVIGSLPAAVIGVLFESFFESLFGTPRIVSLLLLVTAGLLAFSEHQGQKERDLSDLGWVDALLIGLGQAMAIAPGISRSGATMASGLVRGVKRDVAARYSFLLSAPVIIGAGVWQLKDLFASSGWMDNLVPLLVGFAVSALAGYVCIRFLLNYLRRGKLYAFAIYCTLAGIICFVISFVR
ncbi:MAG: undecaprenyl-diphosphate phosphatase [Anaerolineae bacterium]|nr:undecaprenyl-diphosphate phosphatase [Anaerolineae bacterium]